MYLLTRTLHLASALLLYGVAVSAAPPPTQVFVAEARLDRFVDRVEAGKS